MGRYYSEAEVAELFRDVTARLSKLESKTGLATVGSGAPPAGQVDGAIYGDKVGSFFYIVMGGVAKKVAVV